MPPNADILEGHDAIGPFIKGFVQTGAKLDFDLVAVHESDIFNSSLPAGA